MKAVVTVIGKDTVGILASTSAELAKANVNIIEVTQSVLQDFFAMIMRVDISESKLSIDELNKDLQEHVVGMEIHVMHEDIFNSMHRI